MILCYAKSLARLHLLKNKRILNSVVKFTHTENIKKKKGICTIFG